MEITAELKAKIIAIAEDHKLDYDIIAIRVQEDPFQLGQLDHLSHVWEDGDDTGEELSGVCATMISSVRVTDPFAGFYFGDHLAILGGSRYEYGEDPGEVIIEDADVIAILA